MSDYESKMFDAGALTVCVSIGIGIGRMFFQMPVPNHAFLWPPILFFSLAAVGSIYRAHRGE